MKKCVSAKTILAALLVACWCIPAGGASAAEGKTADLVNRKILRVCSDPANLPFSNNKGEGFENKIAEIVADELKIRVEYTWFPMATGFVRRTLFARLCDVIIGYAQGSRTVLNTNHYYRTVYTFVYRKGQGLDGVVSLDDPRLKEKRLGIIAGTPPSFSFARLGLMANARPYQLHVDRRYFSPAERMLEDIRSGEIDAGVLWGPMAGYFAPKVGDDLVVVPLLKEPKSPRMAFRITMGVRQADKQWKRELNEIIKKRQADINKVLLEYGVPLIDEQNQRITSAH